MPKLYTVYIHIQYIYEVILRELYLSYRGFLKKNQTSWSWGDRSPTTQVWHSDVFYRG